MSNPHAPSWATPPPPAGPPPGRWKRLRWWQKTGIIIGGAVVGLFVIGLVGSIVAPIEEDEPEASASSEPTREVEQTPDGEADEPESSEEPEPESSPSESIDMDTIRESTGLPPEPDAATTAAYVAALDAIDPRIDKDDPESAVARGGNQCRTIGENPDDIALQIDLANQRFTHPDAPNGWGLDVAEQINAVVHEYLCPDF